MLAFPTTAIAGYFFIHSGACGGVVDCDSPYRAAKRRGRMTVEPERRSLFWRFVL